MQAIEKAGLKSGKDITIISIDGVKGMFQVMIDGKANCTVECNPLQGRLLMETAKKILAGEKVEKLVYVDEGVFPADVAAKTLPERKYWYLLSHPYRKSQSFTYSYLNSDDNSVSWLGVKIMAQALLEMRYIDKVFPGVKALSNVNFTLHAGEIHSLMGENGAGKSTLVKVWTGVYQRDGGTIVMNGKSIQDCRRLHQAAQNQGFGPGTARKEPVGRKPAKGNYCPLAGNPAESVDSR
ncbi:MAG: ATP-binding cassette domain-containing protein [Selenomonadaceae bacterium]|nr:ATP-binding cassette domain-containing protein [Selenomonadaceae bacterium]